MMPIRFCMNPWRIGGNKAALFKKVLYSLALPRFSVLLSWFEDKGKKKTISRKTQCSIKAVQEKEQNQCKCSEFKWSEHSQSFSSQPTWQSLCCPPLSPSLFIFLLALFACLLCVLGWRICSVPAVISCWVKALNAVWGARWISFDSCWPLWRKVSINIDQACVFLAARVCWF